MKAYIEEQLNAGKKYNEILEEVKREMVSQMLVRAREAEYAAYQEFLASESANETSTN